MMNLILNMIFGGISLLFWSWAYPLLWPYLFINISIKPIIAPCRESFSLDVCRVLARICLWLMELPLNIVTLLVFSVALVLGSSFSKQLRLSKRYILAGSLVSFIVLYAMYPLPSGTHFSYHLVTIITHCSILLGGIWFVGHLTSKGSR